MIADLDVQVGGRVQRVHVVRVHLQDAFEDGIAFLSSPSLSRTSAPSSIARGHAQRRLLGQEQLALGDLDDARPVLVGLVVAAQALVGEEVARVDLRDQLFQRQRGRLGVVQLLVEDLRPLQPDIRGPARLVARAASAAP